MLSQLIGAAFSQPLVSLVLALPVAIAILIVASRPRAVVVLALGADRSVRGRYGPEHRMLTFTALAVIVVFLGEGLLRGYVWQMPGVIAWWRFTTALAVALIGLGILLFLVAGRGSTWSDVPVLPVARRTWTTFGPRGGIVAAGVVLAALLVTTIAAGAASSRDSSGRFVQLEIPIANEPGIDPIRYGFYGWDYGVPVLVCALALAAVAWSVLRANAARPYLRPETVDAEGAERRRIASGAVRIAAAALLLSLAGAWRLIAGAGSVSSLTIIDQGSYEVAWRAAQLAVMAGWAAPVLEIAAFTLLLVVAIRMPQATASDISASGASADPAARAEATR